MQTWLSWSSRVLISTILSLTVAVYPAVAAAPPAKKPAATSQTTPAKKSATKTIPPLQKTAPTKKNAAKPNSPAHVYVATPAKDTPTVLSAHATDGIKLDLLRQVPLEAAHYVKDSSLPANFTTADQVIQALDNKRNLLVHMEAIRRSHYDLSPAEKEKLLDKLFDRYRALNEDAVRFFDHGYAQLVLANNKTGLFFLRKANDALKDQFSALAYGMAQAEADINLEDGDPAQMTTRKLDAIYMFKDAVKRDATAHKPGFWPTFVRVIDQLKSVPAFNDLTDTDHSVAYVPYGNSVFPDAPPHPKYVAQNYMAVAGGCSPYEQVTLEPTDKIFQQRKVDFGNGRMLSVNYYSTPNPNQYKVAVLDEHAQTLARFTSPTAPYIVEDIDNDGIYEFVIRQYQYNRLNPVMVYRMTSCSFELDPDIEANFQ